LLFNQNDSLISRARNTHATSFLDDYPDYDYFFSIDSDIEIINCFRGDNIFDKLIDADKDFIGGLYAMKTNDDVIPASIAMGDDEDIQFDSGTIEMKWLSSGCWCVKRGVMEAMRDAYPELHYTGDDNMRYRTVYGLYIPFIQEIDADHSHDGKPFKKYLSEDWSFCQRWKDLGGDIYADTSIALNHIGKTKFKLWNVGVQYDVVDESETLPPAGHDL
jgi:hypothetical protein